MMTYADLHRLWLTHFGQRAKETIRVYKVWDEWPAVSINWADVKDESDLKARLTNSMSRRAFLDLGGCPPDRIKQLRRHYDIVRLLEQEWESGPDERLFAIPHKRQKGRTEEGLKRLDQWFGKHWDKVGEGRTIVHAHEVPLRWGEQTVEYIFYDNDKVEEKVFLYVL